MRRGFSLIELLVVLAVVAILSAVAVSSYRTYRKHAVKTALMHDLRTCLSYIESKRQTTDIIDVHRLVSECPRGGETRDIQVVSDFPSLVLKAKAVDYNIECSYSSQTGRFSCQ